MSSHESAESVIRGYWNDVWCHGDPAAVARYYGEGAVENAEPVDVADFASKVAAWFTKFPDFRATVEELFVVAPDRVITRVTYTGTHQGTWAGLPATGNPVSGLGIDIFRLRDGRIVEHWHSTDHYDLVVQCGGRVVPT